MAVFFYIYPNQFELENVSLTIIILKIDQEYIICQVLCRLQFIMKGTIIRRRTNMERYGYIRVSTKEQNPERQFIAMQEQQIKQKNIYLDKISGKNFTRPKYSRLLKRLKRGDVVIVNSIDRLGRNYEEILEQWRKIT